MTNKTNNNTNKTLNQLLATSPLPKGEQLKVGIIGGGVAGSTIAIRLAALGVETYLFESKASLIDGPPMCHLHAGGNLYREIPDNDCVELLKQSIDMLRMYPHSIDVRPTIIAIPKRDEGNPEDLLPRLQLLTREYEAMITADPANKVLGEAEDYYRLYDRQQLQALLEANDSDPSLFPEGQIPQELDHWVVNAAKHLNLDKLKFPIVAVQEYGWNIFRLAASAQIALGCYPNAHLLLNTQVINVTAANSANNVTNTDANTNTNNDASNKDAGPKWVINYQQSMAAGQAETKTITVDYLINACGFKTGIIDNMIGIPVQRMVEFKASYVTHWNRAPKAFPTSVNTDLISPSIRMPEIIIHGKRGTPQGMVQLTPYPDGYYQIHSMNKAVTLFKDGLVATKEDDAQPELKPKYLDYIKDGWNPATLHERSQRAIDEVSEFVPKFATATPTGNALYGGQQIPGDNDTLRVADVSLYPELNYARAENVKASSALEASDDIVALLKSQKFINPTAQQNATRQHHQWSYLSHSNKQDVDELARQFATERAFPAPMSGVITPLD